MQAVALGASTSWIFLMVLLFCLKDVDTAISSTAGREGVKSDNIRGADSRHLALLEIYYQATSSRAGAVCLLMFNLCKQARKLICWLTLCDSGHGLVCRHLRIEN